MLVFLLGIGCMWIGMAWGESPVQPAEQGSRQTLTLADLPPVPKELKSLVQQNELTFLIGGERPSLADGVRSTGGQSRRFDAETRFRMSFRFDSSCSWETVKDPRTPDSVKQLAVRVKFKRVRLSVTHRIWFRDMPERDGFWESPLLLHELDHVRISGDPRIANRFRQSVLQNSRIELTREESEPLIAMAYRKLNSRWFGRGPLVTYLNAGEARPFIKTAIQTEFDRTVELTHVRYQELDRITEHGQRQVPETGELRDWLRR